MSISPLWMFACLFIALMLGAPIAFTLFILSIVFGVIAMGPSGVSLAISAIWGGMTNFTLTAIVLFIFMAVVLEKSGIVSNLYDCFYKWFGGWRGGLAVATIVVGAILGAVSGVAAAGVIGLGLVALPSMDKYKYNRGISMGAIMSGGALGQLIPPSLNMVVYGSIVGVSVGQLFAGGISCGLLLAFLYVLYITIRCLFNKDLCPVLPKDQRATIKEKLISLKQVIVPAIIIVVVLGCITTGVTTATEGAAIGAFSSLLFCLFSGRMTWKLIKEAVFDTIRIGSMCGWIIAAANAFGAVFSACGGNVAVANLAYSMPGGKYGVLIVGMLFVVFLGMFLETVAIIMLAAPIITPIIVHLGFDPLWWSLLFMTLLQIGFLSPPFGFALFYLKGITPPDVQIEDLYKSALPYLCCMIVGCIIIVLIPEIATALPRLLMG